MNVINYFPYIINVLIKYMYDDEMNIIPTLKKILRI